MVAVAAASEKIKFPGIYHYWKVTNMVLPSTERILSIPSDKDVIILFYCGRKELVPQTAGSKADGKTQYLLDKQLEHF